MSTGHEEVGVSNVTMRHGGDQGKSSRGRSKDVLTSLEARLVRAEKAVGDVACRLEDEIPTNETLEAMGDELRGELQGALNSMMDQLRREFEERFDRVLGEVTSIREELKEVRGDWALCKEAVVNRAHVVREAPRVDVPKPKPYDGKRDAKELEAFLWSIERYLQHLRIEDDATKISTATLYLTDNALLWWRRRSLEIEQGTFTLETWNAFKEDIKLHFYPPNARYEAKEKLRWLKHSGTIRDYVAEFTNLLFEVSNISEEDKFVYFISGLKPWARQELQRRGVQTVSQAIAAAESLIELKKSDFGHVGEREDRVNGGGEDKDAEENSNKGKSPKWKDNQGGKHKSQFNTNGCYFCGGSHLMRDCPKRKKINAMVAQLEEEENEVEGQVATMSSLKLLNAVEAKPMGLKSQSKGLMFVDVAIGGKTSRALVDTGATHNFISVKEAKRMGLKVSKEGGSVKPVDSPAKPIEGVACVRLHVGSWSGMVELYVITMDEYDLVIGTDFMDNARAFPIPYTNTLCIVGEETSCTVPVVRQVRPKSKSISALQLIEGIKGEKVENFSAAKEDEAPPNTSQDLSGVLEDGGVAKPKKLPKGISPEGKVHCAEEATSKPGKSVSQGNKPSHKEVLVAKVEHREQPSTRAQPKKARRKQKELEGHQIKRRECPTPQRMRRSMLEPKPKWDIPNSLQEGKATRRGRRWIRWGRMSRSVPRPLDLRDYAHSPSHFI